MGAERLDVPELRDLLRPIVGAMKDDVTDSMIPEHCSRIGLPIPGPAISKRERLYKAFDALLDEGVPGFAQRLIDLGMLTPRVRNPVQDILWAGLPFVEVSKRHRRELARALSKLDRIVRNWEHTEALLRVVFVFDTTLSDFIGGRETELEWVNRHFFRFPEDADVEQMFEMLGVFDLSHHRFQVFIEGLVAADVQVDADAQVEVVEACNEVLRMCGAELRQAREEHGYPVFELVPLRSTQARPKTLIFASPDKPDLRFRDVLNNDVEILSDPAKVLVYDRPIIDGLRWRDLQAWWADRQHIAEATLAKADLYRRLKGSLPSNSPPQLLFFETFFKTFGAEVPGLPALLPEVWLHWDPKSIQQRAALAFPSHRMDFLMLLPGGRRFVFEVDGKQHYAIGELAEPREYARLAAGTRDLQLAGYEVYRFGGSELVGEVGQELVARFFRTLFEVHRVSAA
jgi:very-short-patch-repair endonuclease